MDDLCATCGAYFQCEHRDASEAVPLPTYTESWADTLTDGDYANLIVERERDSREGVTCTECELIGSTNCSSHGEQARDVDILDWLTGTHPT